MNIKAQVVRDEKTGRWKWQAVGSEIWPQPDVFIFSVVSFETEEEAQHDMNDHFRGDQDATRRIVRTKDEISKLVRAAVQLSTACGRTEFAAPYWHSPDSNGCNWDLNFAQGEMQPACIEQVGPVIGRIRETYNIPNEG